MLIKLTKFFSQSTNGSQHNFLKMLIEILILVFEMLYV